MKSYPIVFLILSRLSLVWIVLLVGCAEAADPEKPAQGKARLIYVPQNEPAAALEWIAYEGDLISGTGEGSSLTQEDLDQVLLEKANEMIIFPEGAACELSVEEIRREPDTSGQVEIHVEYYAFCEKYPEQVKLNFQEFFSSVTTGEVLWSRSGRQELIKVDAGSAPLKAP
jgi:hypothetical protein